MEITLNNAVRLFEAMKDLDRWTYTDRCERYGEDSKQAQQALTEFGKMHTVITLLTDPKQFNAFCEIFELKEEDSK